MSIAKEAVKEQPLALLDREETVCFTGGGYASEGNVDDGELNLASIPSRAVLGTILTEEKAALAYLLNKGVIQPPLCCPFCRGKLSQMSTKPTSWSRFVVRCQSCKCGKYSSSVLSGSIIANCRFSKEKFLDFCYHWLLGIKGAAIRKSLGMSQGTVTDYSNYLREIVSLDLLMGDKCQIGGPGIVVEIDESKFGKRKYHVSTFVVGNISTSRHLSLTIF